MSDKKFIFAGLVLFLVVITFPAWYSAGAGGADARPEPELPEGESKCVEDKAYMTANHMKLLDEWRNAVVREGKNEYTSSCGEKYVMSLTGTCMKCHSNKETFCNRCHNYANVQPRCWDCHVEPKGN
ncbi:MAG: sulfate reduction electron transfer complex DsrMKJOP subunit DsrJ [Planctomycetota bacterium]|jgi:hypothetical protein